MTPNRSLWYFVALVLTASLLTNALVLRRLAAVEQQVSVLQGSVTGQVDLLRSSVSGQLQQMQAADRWYSPPRFEVLDAGGSCTETRARLTWTFRELGEDAQVGLSYRLGSSAWQEAAVTRATGTTYQADLNVPVNADTAGFSIGLQQGSKNSSMSAPEGPATPAAVLEYVVHVTDQGSRRSGDPERVDVGKLAGFFAAHLATLQPGQRYSATVYKEAGAKCLEPSAVEFWASGPAGELGRTKLTSDPSGNRTTWTGTLDLSTRRDVQEVGVTAVLANGQQVSRSIRVR
ncbi:MAG: hypothetical protein ACM3ZA_00670 [Bacillota bacterium]